MVRYSGAALGLALSKTSHHLETRPWTSKITSVVLGLLIGQTSHYIHQFYLKSQNDMFLFYSGEYVLNMVTVILLISLTNTINA